MGPGRLPVLLSACSSCRSSSTLHKRGLVDSHNEVASRGRPEEVPVGGGGWAPARHQLHQPPLQTQ